MLNIKKKKSKAKISFFKSQVLLEKQRFYHLDF